MRNKERDIAGNNSLVLAIGQARNPSRALILQNQFNITTIHRFFYKDSKYGIGSLKKDNK